VTVQSLRVAGNTSQDTDPQELALRIEKLTLDLAQLGPEGSEVDGSGVRPMVVDARVDYRFSRKSGELELNQLEIAGQDLITFGVSVHLATSTRALSFPRKRCRSRR